MAHSRSSQRLAPTWSWIGDIGGAAITRARAANTAGGKMLEGSSIGARFWIEGSSARPSGCVRHRAIRRIDDTPVWIVIPEDVRAYAFSYVIPFLRAAKLARELRHPYVLRTHEAGLLDDGRPYVVVARVPSESLASWLGHRGPTSWSVVRPLALRLCSAVEAARERGLAPRELDLESCLHVREGQDEADVRLGELFVLGAARPRERDVPAIAGIVHALVGGKDRNAALDAVLARALGDTGYPDIAALTEAFAAIEHEGVRESHGSNHAAIAGTFEVDCEAEEAADAARPIPRWVGDVEAGAL